MLEYAYGHNDVVGQFVSDRIPSMYGRPFGRCTAIGIVEGTEMIAGLVYHNWRPEARVIEISAAALPGRNWMTRETIRQMYEYPFRELNCQMVYMHTSEHNERVLRILSALGHAFVRIPRLLGPDEDSIVCTLTIEQWAEHPTFRRLRYAPVQLSEAA